MKKKIILLIFLSLLVLGNFQLATAEEDELPFFWDMFPIEVTIATKKYPEFPQYNQQFFQDSSDSFTFAADTKFEMIATTDKNHKIYFTGEDINGNLVTVEFPSWLVMIPEETLTQPVQGGVTFQQYVKNVLGIEFKSPAEFVRKFDFSDYNSRTGSIALNMGSRAFMDYLYRIFNEYHEYDLFYGTTYFFDVDVKEPGEPAYPVMDQIYTPGETVFTITNNEDMPIVYDLRNSSRTKITDIQNYDDPFGVITPLIKVLPNTTVAFFHFYYDANDKNPPYSPWYNEMPSNSIGHLLNNISFYLPERGEYYFYGFDHLNSDRANGELVGYFDPNTNMYDLFYKFPIQHPEEPVWLMTIFPKYTFDEEGNYQGLQVWEYGPENYVEIPPYIFSYVKLDQNSFAEEWYWVIVRAGFHEYMQQQIDLVKP